MFQRWKEKWNVSWGQFALIFCTFALGGSLCGYTGRKLLDALQVHETFLWVILYIILAALLWPMCVLVISIPLGQWAFFWKYVGRMVKVKSKKSKVKKEDTLNSIHQTNTQEFQNEDNQKPETRNQKPALSRLAIFASGAGSNTEKIIQHFKGHPSISIALIVCNKPGAGVLNIAAANGIPTLLIEKERFFRGDAYTQELKEAGIRFIVLAGFLWKVPGALIAAYPDHIINIHPALLPKYGGKGMYGHFVQEAVIANQETESGITIHYVNEHFDEGAPIFQATCPVLPGDTADTLAQRIHQLEHAHYAEVIEQVVNNMSSRL